MTKIRYFQTECKSFERTDNGVRFKGFASTPDIDRGQDVVLPEAFKSSLDEYIKNPVLLRSHNSDRPVGNILTEGEDAPRLSGDGLFVTGLVTEKETADQVMAGEMRTMSIGFIPLKVDFQMVKTGKYDASGQELELESRIIKELDLVEISIVATPANPKALFTVEKSVNEYFSSLPSPTMEHNCDYCERQEAKACGKVGSKFICKACIDSIEFKGDEEVEMLEVKEEETEEVEEVETAEEAAEESAAEDVAEDEEGEDESESEEADDSAETAETSDESSEAESESEEEEEEGSEEKHVVSKEQKQQIDYAAKLLNSLNQVTKSDEEEEEEEQEEETEEKSVKADTSVLTALLPIMVKMAEELQVQRKAVTDLAAVLANTPVAKGKTFKGLQFEAQEKKESSDSKDSSGNAFKSMLTKARQSEGVSVEF